MTDCGDQTDERRSGRTANYEKLSTSSFGKPVSQSDIQSSVQEMLAHLKMVHMELDMVADMEVDKVADMAAEMFKTKCMKPEMV